MTDWTGTWRELATAELMAGPGESQMVERWRGVAARLDRGADYPDSLLEFVMSRLEPGWTVLDVGAGVGRWAIPIAGRVRAVTCVEPSSAMRQMLEERSRAHGRRNVTTVGMPWPEADVPVHDVAVAVFSMYTSPDLVGFVRKMEASARQACYLALRVPAHDGIIGELSERIRGNWHDSPNFVVAYNLLLQAGFYPNVVMEPKPVRFWTDANLDEAMARAKRHLRLADDATHDGLIRDTLERRLIATEGLLRWPDAMRSAVIWWGTRQ